MENKENQRIDIWTTQQPVPRDISIFINNLKLIKIREFLQLEGVDYPDLKPYHENIVNSLLDEKNFLGSGGKGRVYSFEAVDGKKRSVCIKIMKHEKFSYHNEDRGNDPIEEFSIQTKLSLLNPSTSTKFPRAIQLLDCKNDFYAFVMEKLPASNLQKIFLEEEKLPENFDVKNCMDRLYELVDEMHEAGIVHNDLEARNIMIDNQSGLPYIIDFGRSLRVSYDEQSLKAKKARDGDFDNLKIIEENFFKRKT